MTSPVGKKNDSHSSSSKENDSSGKLEKTAGFVGGVVYGVFAWFARDEDSNIKNGAKWGTGLGAIAGVCLITTPPGWIAAGIGALIGLGSGVAAGGVKSAIEDKDHDHG